MSHPDSDAVAPSAPAAQDAANEVAEDTAAEVSPSSLPAAINSSETQPGNDETSGRDPHPWRSTLILSVIFVAGGLALSLKIWGWIYGTPGYSLAGDLWTQMLAGRYALYDFAFIYSGTANFVAMPATAIMYAPVVAIADALKMTTNEHGYYLAEASAWPVLYGYGLVTGTLLLYATRRAAWSLGVRIRLWWVQLAVMLLCAGIAGVIWGHFEDVVMVGFILLAVVAFREEKWTKAAWLVAGALCFKQTALLVLPLMFVLVPKEHRVRFVVFSLFLPLALVATQLVADWQNTTEALLRAPTFPTVGHRAPWVLSPSEFVLEASPVRWGMFALAVFVAYWLRNTRNWSVLVAGFGVVLLGRFFVEAVVHPYYLAPAFAFAVLYAASTHRRIWTLVVVGVPTMVLYFSWYPTSFGRPPEDTPKLISQADTLMWWGPLLVLIALCMWPIIVATIRRRPGRPARPLFRRNRGEDDGIVEAGPVDADATSAAVDKDLVHGETGALVTG